MNTLITKTICTRAGYLLGASFRGFAWAVGCAAWGIPLSSVDGATLNVTTYGAVANDAGDDRAAIQSAITEKSFGKATHC